MSISSKDKSNNEIIRVVKARNNFVVMDKGFLENPELSWKAKGLLAYLLSKPDNWKVIVSDLVNHGIDGKTAIYNGLKELKEYGYYHKVPVRDEKGTRISHWEGVIYECPMDAAINATQPKTTATSNATKDVPTQNQSVKIGTDKMASSQKTVAKARLFLFPENQEIENQDIGFLDIENRERNNNYINNNYLNNNLVKSNQSGQDDDRTDDNAIQAYAELLKKNISFDDLKIAHNLDTGLLDELLLVMVDAITTVSPSIIRIKDEEKPRALVKNVLLKLNYWDIDHVINQFKSVTTPIKHKKQYLLAMLFNCKHETNAHIANLYACHSS